MAKSINKEDKRLEDMYDRMFSYDPMIEKKRRKDNYERKIAEKRERRSKKEAYQFR